MDYIDEIRELGKKAHSLGIKRHLNDYMEQVTSEPWCGGKFEDWMLHDLRRKLMQNK